MLAEPGFIMALGIWDAYTSRVEDQIFPKRVHYHKGLEHVVPR